MVAVIIKNKVTDLEAYLPLAKAFAADASMETGCIEMKVYVDPEDTFISSQSGKQNQILKIMSKARFLQNIFHRWVSIMYPAQILYWS